MKRRRYSYSKRELQQMKDSRLNNESLDFINIELERIERMEIPAIEAMLIMGVNHYTDVTFLFGMEVIFSAKKFENGKDLSIKSSIYNGDQIKLELYFIIDKVEHHLTGEKDKVLQALRIMFNHRGVYYE